MVCPLPFRVFWLLPACLLAACSPSTSSKATGSVADAASADGSGMAVEVGAMAEGDGGPDAAAWRTVLDDDFPLPLAPGIAPTPPMGWNSWNAFACSVTAADIERAADQLVATGMADAGYEYVNIDDCWALPDRAADGTVQVDPSFSDAGMLPVADYVHAKGLKLGIYSDRGTGTCQMRAGSQGHESQDALSYASWGVDYVKYDNCNAQSDTMQTQYQTMRDAIAASGRPMVFSLCSWEFDEWDLATGQLWRTTSDIAPNWVSTVANMGSVLSNLNKNEKLAAYAGPNGWNDPDMLEVGNPGLTLAEARAHFSLWCILAAPLIAGNDVRHMTPEIRAILTDKDVIAIDQDALGKEGWRFRAEPGREIWVRQLADGGWVVALLNAGSTAADLTVDFPSMWLFAGKFAVRDLWAKKDAGTNAEVFTAHLAPHDAALLRLTPSKP